MFQVAEYYGFPPGRNGFIQCPFHQGDRTPSLKLYENGWKCFGCNRGGSVIDFAMELFDLSFSQALVRLSSDFRLGVTETRKSPLEASRILAQRRAEAENKERERQTYYDMAAEHERLWAAKKWLVPSRECPEPCALYMEAVRRLPYLENWLEEHMGR